MKINALIIILIVITNVSQAQSIRPLDQLIDRNEPAWPIVQQWIAQAKNKVEILPVDTAKAAEALYKTQVTTRSPMGAIVYSTGGILIDDGWIRILGSGSSRLPRSLPQWNQGKTVQNPGEKPLFYLVADDVVGGFYAINGGGLGADIGKMYYLSPDNLNWESMNTTYSEFLTFCFSGNLKKYYTGFRWKGWQLQLPKLPGDQCMNFYPPLFTKEGRNIDKDNRKAVPIEEQYRLNLDMRSQLGIGK